jgi:two-component system response regulator AtoC
MSDAGVWRMEKDKIKPSCDQLIDMMSKPFVIIDKNYEIRAANRAYRERYEVKERDVVGRKCHEVSHHSDVPCSQHGEHCPLEAVFGEGQPSQVMHVHYDNKGDEEYVQLQAAPIFGSDGEVLYIGETINRVSHSEADEPILIGRSRPLLRLTSILQRVAPTQTSVLLLGESGTGKERAAEYIHQYSTRSGGPFVVVDCSTLGENLIESELFGAEKGSYTGATQLKKGLFEAAHGGTLFVDEIGELPLPMQTKLLRALESSTIRRVGGTGYIRTDVRVIAATNRDLKTMVEAGEFREDLYYRLTAFPVTLPPLRERKDDIPALAEHFLKHLSDGDRHLPLSPELIEALLDYDYPGNIRELRNIVERAAILAIDDVMRPEHLMLEEPGRTSGSASGAGQSSDALIVRRGRLTDSTVLDALNKTGGHRARAAKMLGVSERTLYRYVGRMKQSA